MLENNLRSILDVGCRDCVLMRYLGETVDEYKGCDLFQNATNSVSYVLNIEEGLPLEKDSFDCVVALDLIEHLNGFQEGVEELLRITKKDLIIMLPNMSHLLFRIKFLFTGKIAEKYSLDINNSCRNSDRHRWFTVLPETNQFMEGFAKRRNLILDKFNYIGNGKKMMFFAKMAKLFRLPESLYVWSTIYILKKYES